jgi:hypothetical protein
LFADESGKSLPGRIEINIGAETTGRFLRVTPNGSPKRPAALAEVEVWGHLSTQ